MATVCGGIALVTGILVALELPILTGSIILEYRNPYSTHPVALLLTGPYAPYIHVVLFVGCLTLFLLLRRKQ